MNDKKDILHEVFQLIEEQTMSLKSRLSPELAVQCKERSERIRKLLEQVGVSKQAANQR